jgi:dTDP-4-amino-4,6-dideoxygalactose transaminase
MEKVSSSTARRSPSIGPARTSIPMVDLAAQMASLEAELREAIDKVLRRADFILGTATAEFEQAFAQFLGAKYAVGVGNCLDALRLSLSATGIQRDDEVLVPANTFIATALAVSSLGARPVFVDCDPHTYNVDVHAIEPAITSRTRAIIPVHLTGQPADMDPLLDIARRHRLIVIEDTAHAPGALYRGQACGTFGTTGCFSFYPGKSLGACGDAGLIATNDSQLADHLCCARHYGQRAKYEHVEQGVNSRLDTLQAAILNVKLKYLPAWNQSRRRIAAEYRRRLADVGDLTFQQCLADCTHVYHLFVIETDHRDTLRAFLVERGIEAMVHYPRPIHLQPAYQPLGYREGDFPQSERLSRRMLSLPIFPEMSDEQLSTVVEAIEDYFIAASSHRTLETSPS